MLLQAERDAKSILLNDWTHELSDVIWSRYFTTGAFPSCVDSILANGYGRVSCLPEYILQAGPLGQSGANQTSAMMSPSSMVIPGMEGRMEMGDSTTKDMVSSTMVMDGPAQTTESPVSTSTSKSPEMTSLSPRGCSMPMMFKPGFNASSLPAETCTNTSSPQLHIPANTTQGWLALNLVNSGAVSALRVSMDGHSMFVYAADGLFVELQEVKVSPTYRGSSPLPWLTLLGAAYSPWSTIFSDDPPQPDCRELLSQVCYISRRRHAASP